MKRHKIYKLILNIQKQMNTAVGKTAKQLRVAFDLTYKGLNNFFNKSVQFF